MYMYRFVLEKGAAAMKLTFQNSSGKEHVIADVASDDEAYERIKKFCDEHGFTIRYTRMWTTDRVTKYDVGSHTEFFKLYLND